MGSILDQLLADEKSDALGVKPLTITVVEKPGHDLKLSSLKRNVEATGGKLRSVIELPDGTHHGHAMGSPQHSPPQWYLLQSKPRQAERAQLNLERQGYEVFCPRITVERVQRQRRQLTKEPLFPNYLFIRLQRWVDNWYPLRSTRGVARLVAFGQEPAAVDQRLIDAIAQRCAQCADPPQLQPGQRVEILDGPFAGLSAIFQAPHGEKRVHLLLELLQRPVSVSLPREQVCAGQ